MPSVSEKQREMFGAALRRKRMGQALSSDPKMTEAQLSEFASSVSTARRAHTVARKVKRGPRA